MSVAITKIDRYQVVLDSDQEECHVSYGRFSAELGALSLYGTLCHEDGAHEHVVPAWVIGRIEEWAKQHGLPT